MKNNIDFKKILEYIEEKRKEILSDDYLKSVVEKYSSKCERCLEDLLNEKS